MRRSAGPVIFDPDRAVSRTCMHPRLTFRTVVLCGMLLAGSLPSSAQETDSLKTYDLSEIVIGGQSRQGDDGSRVFRVGLADLARQDVPDVASTLRLLPSASIQTNSRGETLVYIRAAGERQVAVFLDGAPLNVAWDNRIDLSLVPANILGGMSVERGALGPGYGTNTSGGALNLRSRRLEADGSLADLTVQTGTAGSRQMRGLYASRRSGNGILFGATVSRSDGMPLPENASLPFEPDSDLRTNTDRNESNLYLKLDREWEQSRIGLTLMHARAEKGVAPEGHLDPSVNRVRYWRYPLWQHSMAILNGVHESRAFQLSGSAWLSRFRQDIEDYGSVDYRTPLARQEDTDGGAGVRFIAERMHPSWHWRAITVVSASEHRQNDRDLGPSAVFTPEMRYRSVLHTLGGEITSGSAYPGHWAVGAAWDGMRTPETGAFPSSNSFDAYSLNAEWHRELGTRSLVKLNAGSKPRFPTMRELFGTALDRFVINPALKPERTWMIEGGWQISSESWESEVTLFAQRTKDTIDQENVTVDDGSRKRKRVNLDGSRVLGAEWMGATSLTSIVQVRGHVTWLRPVAIEKAGNRHLTEKPEVLVTVQTRIEPFRNLGIDVTGIYTGRAYGLAPNNDQVTLPTSLRLNIRMAVQRYFSATGVFLQVYAGLDNVTDERHLPQLGLPDAGRTARVGMSLSR